MPDDELTELRRLRKEDVGELSDVFYQEISADQLLMEAGFSRGELPPSSSSKQRWTLVNQSLGNGDPPGGRRRILDAALSRYPANHVFKAGLDEAVRAEVREAELGGTPAEGQTVGSAFGPGAGPGPGAGGSAFAGGSRQERGFEPGSSGGGSDAFSGLLVPTTVVVVDIVDYSSRSARVHMALRDGLQEMVSKAFSDAQVPADVLRWQDSGDGFVITVDASFPTAVIVAEFVHRLRIALSDYNQVHDGAARMRLRLAMHQGQAARHRTGWVGPAVIVGARLVDSAPIRDELKDNPAANLALIVSSALFDDVVRERFLGLEPASFREVPVKLKSFTGTAWLTLPGYVSAQRPGPSTADGRSTTASGSSGPSATDDLGASSNIVEWDFFVSVAEEDNDWGRWITWYLEEEEGYKVRLEEWDVQAGGFDPKALNDAVKFSRRTIVVLSRAYLESPKVDAAWQHAWDLDPNGLDRRLIPVRIQKCEPEGLMRGIRYIDLVGRSDDEAKEYFGEQIRRSVQGKYRPSVPPPFPAPRS
ncbi:toll/interleukin-1 receptor domain-containing protein [Pseudofrankia sp. BMG5.37]|uniref:toll/interleukin-1 receptor domain-containing protein n=1 Tax=Pseudofrankia sp. BMG5.37 TaxID=3050035 RepID=UPI0028959A1D|nr:toll/interleukin-1 receptor domain-containing protein [Pseudofrankia sp. BMG5.37]MDT3445200.1 toll/interleukin-1 receptor domain-containing protein [Pseudofrankia sp. BMG5.37]